jgi:opacity protein-like surface antigen
MKFRLLIATIFAAFICNAQEWEAGISIGPSQYQGDLAKEQMVLKKTKLGGGLIGRYTFNPSFALRAEINVMKVAGDDKLSKDPSHSKRNLNFNSFIEELTISGEYNFFKYVPGSKSKRFTPFISAGVGLFHFNPTTTYKGQTVDLQPLKTELNKPNYALTQVCFPIGGGIKYNIASTWSLGLNYATRFTMTDYLDDVSRQYQLFTGPGVTQEEADLTWRAPELDPVKYHNQPENQPGDPKKTVNRGDPRDRDTYIFLGFTITKTFRAYSCNAF